MSSLSAINTGEQKRGKTLSMSQGQSRGYKLNGTGEKIRYIEQFKLFLY